MEKKGLVRNSSEDVTRALYRIASILFSGGGSYRSLKPEAKAGWL